MKIKLKNAIASAEVNSIGGYVDNYEVDDVPVLFPNVMVKIGEELKVRGGMHVCAPNFGKDELLNELPSHGFARDLEWQLVKSSESSAEFKLDGLGLYENVEFKLSYELDYTTLKAKLTITNNTANDKPIAPGFHPYFYADHKPIIINDKDISKEDLPSSIYSKEESQKFIANGNNIEVKGISNVNEYVFWTDFKGDYICVEPTYHSIAFSDQNRNVYNLSAGEEFIQEIKIKVNI